MTSYQQKLALAANWCSGFEGCPANLNVIHTTSQPGSPGSFFSLPLEIREWIYEFYSINDGLIWSFKSQKDYDKFHGRSTVRRLSGSSCHGQGRSANALINTCRQAYLEGSKAFYQSNGFSLYSGWTLRKFLREMQPIHIKSIRELHIARPFDLGPTRKGNRSDIHLADVSNFYKSFTNLEILHLAGMSHMVSIIGLGPVPGSHHGHAAILYTLYALTKTLKRLKKITLTADMPRSEVLPYTSNDHSTHTFDHIPGWVYSVVSYKKVYQSRHIRRVTETLERAHGPFWPGGPSEIR